MIVENRLLIELELWRFTGCSDWSSTLSRIALFPTMCKEWSSPANSYNRLQNSSVHPVSMFGLRQDSWIWNRSTIDVSLLLRLFQSFFGLDRVLSDLLIHRADLAFLRLCELHTKRLSERRTSPFSLRASSAKKKRSNTTIASINFFTQRKYWIWWEIWHKSKPSKISLSVNNFIWFLAEWQSRWITMQFNNEWMQLLFGWDIIACTNLPMLCFRQFSSCCWGSLRGRPWHLTPTLGLVVTLSATCFSVLSRRTCQTLRRVTLVAIVAITNPLIQNFARLDICHFFKRVGRRRVVEDDDIGIRLPKCQILCFEHFSDWSKKCILVHIPVSSRKNLSFMGTTVQNTVYRPSFTSFLPGIRPDWSMGLQETEELTCWMCSSKTYGIGTLSCNDKPTWFLPWKRRKARKHRIFPSQSKHIFACCFLSPDDSNHTCFVHFFNPVFAR